MRSYRPTGITLIAILFIAFGVFDVLGALSLLFIPLPDPFSGMTLVPGLIGILMAGFYLLVGWGLLQLREWARVGAIVLSGLALLGYLLSGALLIAGFNIGGVPIRFSGVGVAMLLLGIVPAVILWYLVKPDIRALFSSGGMALNYDVAPPVSLPPTVASSSASISAAPPPTVSTYSSGPRMASAPVERTRQIDQAPRALAWLVVQGGPYGGKQFGLSEGRNIIGRDGTRSDFILDDEMISGQHAQVRFENGQFVIYDLASTNHTFVNNRQVQRQPLMDNDVVRLGNTQIVFKSVPKTRQ